MFQGRTPWLTLGKILTLTIYFGGRKFPRKARNITGQRDSISLKKCGIDPTSSTGGGVPSFARRPSGMDDHRPDKPNMGDVDEIYES